MARTEMELESAKQLLEGYLQRVPPAVNRGSYNLSVEFKDKVAQARKVLTKRSVQPHELQGAINSLHRYWEMA